jgi:Na+/H+ antiporter NhaC
MNPKLVVALLLAVISLGGILTTVYVFSVPSSFLLRAVVVGLLAAVHVPLLFAVAAYVYGKKDLSKKLLGWLAMQR